MRLRKTEVALWKKWNTDLNKPKLLTCVSASFQKLPESILKSIGVR